MKYDIIIIGAGPGGIFSAYELTRKATGLKIAVFEESHLCHHERLRRGGRFLGRQIQHHERLWRHAL